MIWIIGLLAACTYAAINIANHWPMPADNPYEEEI